jgi:ribosome-associated protein
MDSKKLAMLCRGFADDRKAENIVILDLRKLGGIADFMVVCSGSSEPHLRAIEDEIDNKLRRDHGIQPRAIDGTRQSGWIVLDYVDVLVHVMKPDVREHYDLEGLWNDVPRVRETPAKTTRTTRARKTKAVAEEEA